MILLFFDSKIRFNCKVLIRLKLKFFPTHTSSISTHVISKTWVGSLTYSTYSTLRFTLIDLSFISRLDLLAS